MNDTQLPTTCPNCGKPLRERKGKYGKSLGCSGYPECKFTYDLAEYSRILCPICDKKLKIRLGKFKKYLSCSGYPECTFNYYPDNDNQEFILSCPDCKKDLSIERTLVGLQLSCKGCPFTLSMNREDMILCSICGRPMMVRTGRYGKFLGCTGYPECTFTYNLDPSKTYKGRTRELYCPKCNGRLKLKSENSLVCSKSPQCDFEYYIK